MKSLLNVPADITNAEFVDPYPGLHHNIVVGVWSGVEMVRGQLNLR